MRSPTTGRLLSKEQPVEASLATSKSRSKLRGNHVPILIAGNNELAQLMKLIEKMQDKMEESDKKEE